MFHKKLCFSGANREILRLFHTGYSLQGIAKLGGKIAVQFVDWVCDQIDISVIFWPNPPPLTACTDASD